MIYNLVFKENKKSCFENSATTPVQEKGSTKLLNLSYCSSQFSTSEKVMKTSYILK